MRNALQLFESLEITYIPSSEARRRDLGASVAAQMHEVAERLPVVVAHAALARYGFIEA